MNVTDSLRSTLEELDRRVTKPEAGSIAMLLGNEMIQMVRSGETARALVEDLQRSVAEPTWMGNWKPNELVLYAGHRVELSVWTFATARQYIHTVSSHTLMVPCTSAPLAYRRYRLPDRYDNTIFDRTLKIDLVDEGTTPEGELLWMEGGGLLHDFVITQPTPVLKLTYGPIESMEWLFNRDSLAAWKIGDSDLAATQRRVGAYMLGQIASPTSVDVLKELTHDRSHAVRWAAIQALARINVSEALQRLTAALSDPHPHIRRAAERSLGAMQHQRLQ